MYLSPGHNGKSIAAIQLFNIQLYSKILFEIQWSTQSIYASAVILAIQCVWFFSDTGEDNKPCKQL